MNNLRAVVALVVATALSFGLAGCSDDDGEDVGTEATDTTASAPAESSAPDDTSTESTAPTETSTPPEPLETTVPESVAPPTTTAAAPDDLGVPSEYGMEYPDGTTCAEAEAAFAVMGQDTLIALAEGGGTWIWLAIDEPSASADLFSAPDRTLVQIRGGEIAFEGEPDVADLPALGGDVSYATLTSDTENGITDCVDGPVVD